jgi:2-methylcitrate dehydratase PrpD
MTLGVAAANGVLAARSAREGLVGTTGLVLSSKRLTRGLGRRYLFDEVGMKPYPTARQALAAIEAAREIVAAQSLKPLDPLEIVEVVVRLPECQRAIVDHPAMPGSRFESIVSVQYQIALALVEPDRLLDVRRTPPFADDRVRRLMSRIRVRRGRELDRYYPKAWPARIDITTRGRRYSRLVLRPRGDARNPFGWDDAAAKFRALAGPVVGPAAADRIITDMRAATADAATPPLWDLQ